MTNFELIEESPCGLKRRVIHFHKKKNRVQVYSRWDEEREPGNKWRCSGYDASSQNQPITPAQQAAAVEFFRQQITFKEW